MSAPFQTIPITHIPVDSPRFKQVLQDFMDQVSAMFGAGRIGLENMTDEAVGLIESAAEGHFTPLHWSSANVVNPRVDYVIRRVGSVFLATCHLYCSFSGAPDAGDMFFQILPPGWRISRVGITQSIFIGNGVLRDASLGNTVRGPLFLGWTTGQITGVQDDATVGVWHQSTVTSPVSSSRTNPITIAADDSMHFFCPCFWVEPTGAGA